MEGRPKEDFYAAYLRSGSDAEAAALLGIHDLTFGNWRRQQGLQAKGSAALPGEEDARRRAAYEATASDAEAAARLGIAPAAFGGWRRDRGLVSKYELRTGLRPKGSPGPAGERAPRSYGPRNLQEEAARVRAYEESETDTQAARRLGISIGSFSSWRTSRGFPPKRAKGSSPLTPAEQEAREQAYASTTSDAEAAEQLGMRPESFGAWRKKQGLKAKRGADAAIFSDASVRKHAKYWAAFCSAADDTEAALKAGTSALSFRRWRQRLGLPAIRSPTYNTFVKRGMPLEAWGDEPNVAD